MEHAFRKILEGGGGALGAFVRVVLWLPGKTYGCAMRVRRFGYERGWFRRFRPSVPVVSVGNITAGGSGKTPFTILLAELFRDAGRKPAILLRGYRRTGGGFSDEAVLYRQRLQGVPVFEGRDRRLSARRAMKAGADVIIMDDGFQHLRLERDLDIVLVDATSPWGGGNTLPGGTLREPPSALDRADIVVITRSDQASPEQVEAIRSRIGRLAPDAPVYTACHKPTRLATLDGRRLRVEDVSGREVILLAGIARPEAFTQTVTSCGGIVLRTVAVPDHGDFPKGLVERCLAEATGRGGIVVTTEKDRMKILHSLEGEKGKTHSNVIQSGNREALWVLGVEQEVDDLPSLRDMAESRLCKPGARSDEG